MQLVLEGDAEPSGIWVEYKGNAEQFICSCAQKSSQNVKKTPGGLLWFLPWNNNQYVSTAAFAMSAYSKYLSENQANFMCTGANVGPSDLTSIVRSQVINSSNSVFLVFSNLSLKVRLYLSYRPNKLRFASSKCVK